MGGLRAGVVERRGNEKYMYQIPFFTGHLPEWSDCEEPALVGTCDLPVINGRYWACLFFSRYWNAHALFVHYVIRSMMLLSNRM